MPDNARIAAEMLAVADALRQARAQLCRLVHEGRTAVRGQPATRTVAVEGLDVAAALETLAQRLKAEN
jgi:hypothetical protein